MDSCNQSKLINTLSLQFEFLLHTAVMANSASSIPKLFGFRIKFHKGMLKKPTTHYIK